MSIVIPQQDQIEAFANQGGSISICQGGELVLVLPQNVELLIRAIREAKREALKAAASAGVKSGA